MRVSVFGIFVLLLLPLFAGNPLVKDVGMSDPHIRIFGDAVYLFCGHDATPDDPTWVMRDWRVFKSVDLINWEHVSTISTADNYMADNSTDCWAGDAAERNGKYYFYFSDQKRSIGVMKANSPEGTFKDVLGKPLVAPMHDPTILIDDDKAETPYMVYGDKEGDYHVVRLRNDMISLAEKPKSIVITGKEWEAAPIWMDKNYIFKYKGTYYLSWGRDYATSKSIYGPYESVGSVGQGHHLDQYAHGSFFHWNGQFYHTWCYYIRSGYKYRETIMTYCHMADDGTIVTDTKFLDLHYKTGVGQYDASWDKIEAEWFTDKSEYVTKKGTAASGFVLTSDGGEAWLKYANVDFSSGKMNTIEMLLRDVVQDSGIEVREGSIDGDLLATVPLCAHTGMKIYSAKMKKLEGKHDIYLSLKGASSLDWLKFLEK